MKLLLKNNKDVFLKDATYTSCNIDDPDWQLTSTSTFFIILLKEDTHII